MAKLIQFALSPGLDDDVIVEKFGLIIKRKDMETLSETNWLNDEVIHFYMNLTN